MGRLLAGGGRHPLLGNSSTMPPPAPVCDAASRRTSFAMLTLVEMAREGVPLVVIQRQLGHANLGITSVYLQGIDSSEIISTVHGQALADDLGQRRPPDDSMDRAGREPSVARDPLPYQRVALGALRRLGQPVDVERAARELAPSDVRQLSNGSAVLSNGSG